MKGKSLDPKFIKGEILETRGESPKQYPDWEDYDE